jgi:hypothetical protein
MDPPSNREQTVQEVQNDGDSQRKPRHVARLAQCYQHQESIGIFVRPARHIVCTISIYVPFFIAPEAFPFFFLGYRGLVCCLLLLSVIILLSPLFEFGKYQRSSLSTVLRIFDFI